MARYKQLLFVIGASCLCFGPAPTFAAKPKAKATSEPITIGTSHRLHADDLGEDRTVNVVLPSSYAKDPSRRYPVLYLIDGGVDQDLLHIAELVGSTRDPDLLKRYPTAGSSANFRAFIRNQVKPLVADRYRTNGRDAVLGESLAGLFVIETYLNEPNLFGSYGAIDPSLWWDKEALSQTAMQKIGEVQKGHPLFLAVAKEQSEEPAAYQRTISALRGRQMTFCFALRPEQTHATIYQQTSPEVVQYLMPPAEAPSVFRVTCAEKMP
jgi:predicted alpha/beta superfamily hydrolase